MYRILKKEIHTFHAGKNGSFLESKLNEKILYMKIPWTRPKRLCKTLQQAPSPRKGHYRVQSFKLLQACAPFIPQTSLFLVFLRHPSTPIFSCHSHCAEPAKGRGCGRGPKEPFLYLKLHGCPCTQPTLAPNRAFLSPCVFP